MTPLFAFLNDRSTTLADDVHEAQRRMSTFVRTYRQLTTRVRLRTDDELSGLELALDYPLARWRNDESVDKEERSYFRTIVHRSPPLVDLPDQQEEAGATEAWLEGVRSQSCLAAYLASGLMLSFDADPPRWDRRELVIEVDALDQQLEIVRVPVELPHASQPGHVDHWRTWIDFRLRTVGSAQELWERRNELYPNLVLFPRVEDDLIRLSPDQFQQVRVKLDDLQRESERWTRGGFPHAQLPNPSPESQPTMARYSDERTFTGPDGARQEFTWHLRYTPHAGRLYYHPNQPGTVWIGYIGPHLPTVSDPS